MFSKIATVVALSFGLLVAAKGGPGAQCATGTQSCCNSVQDSGVPQVAELLASVGLQLGAGIPIGLTCDPITVVLAASNSCSQQPVCCNDDNFQGLVAVGCTPLNLAL